MTSPWYQFEQGFRATTAQPYQELEVLPRPDGWRWTVERMVPETGCFRLVAFGLERSERAAKTAAASSAGLK
jgi:hypothetical protein